MTPTLNAVSRILGGAPGRKEPGTPEPTPSPGFPIVMERLMAVFLSANPPAKGQTTSETPRKVAPKPDAIPEEPNPSIATAPLVPLPTGLVDITAPLSLPVPIIPPGVSSPPPAKTEPVAPAGRAAGGEAAVPILAAGKAAPNAPAPGSKEGTNLPGRTTAAEIAPANSAAATDDSVAAAEPEVPVVEASDTAVVPPANALSTPQMATGRPEVLPTFSAAPVNRETPEKKSPVAAGTTVAQQAPSMKTAAKTTDSSGAKQKLPVPATAPVAVAPVSKEILPVTAERGPGKDLRLPRTIAVAAAPVPATPFSSPSPDSNREVAGARAIDVVVPPAPDGVPAVERVRELVSFQVMRLQEAGGGELRVVVKPDAGTQLSLNLRQHEDAAVTVQAVVERGNFELLNRHWPELQQQLESRGVRLTPLAQAETSFGGGSEGFRQPATSRGQHAGDEEPSATTATRIPGLPTATATAFASKSSSARLETWA